MIKTKLLCRVFEFEVKSKSFSFFFAQKYLKLIEAKRSRRFVWKSFCLKNHFFFTFGEKPKVFKMSLTDRNRDRERQQGG
jgi:hypothetical protein